MYMTFIHINWVNNKLMQICIYSFRQSHSDFCCSSISVLNFTLNWYISHGNYFNGNSLLILIAKFLWIFPKIHGNTNVKRNQISDDRVKIILTCNLLWSQTAWRRKQQFFLVTNIHHHLWWDSSLRQLHLLHRLHSPAILMSHVYKYLM